MNVNETGNFIACSTLFFYFYVVRSIGQVDEMEFDEKGQCGLKQWIQLHTHSTNEFIEFYPIRIGRRLKSAKKILIVLRLQKTQI